jgi:hypothetical protein
MRRAARAAGVFRDFTAAEWANGALHTWAKKRFVDSFSSYDDTFLLPDGEIKNLLAGIAQAKILPAPVEDWSECRARGERYRERLAEYSAEVRQFHASSKKAEPRPAIATSQRLELLARQKAELLAKCSQEEIRTAQQLRDRK